MKQDETRDTSSGDGDFSVDAEEVRRRVVRAFAQMVGDAMSEDWLANLWSWPRVLLPMLLSLRRRIRFRKGSASSGCLHSGVTLRGRRKTFR